MADGRPELDPLLEAEHAPWEAACTNIEAGNNGAIKLDELFASHPDDVLRMLQNHGVTKLGEFKVKSDVVFPAFKSHSVLTLGTDERFISHESVWRKELARLCPRGKDSGGWSADVIVEAFVVNVHGSSFPDKEGLVHPLLKRWQAGGCSLAVFGLPAVTATINFKWNAFAKRLLLWETAVFMVWLLSFYIFTFLFQDENLDLTLSQLMATPRGAACVGFECLALVAMAPFLVLEQGTLAAYGFKGWLNIWNGLDVATYALQLAASAMHLKRWDLKGETLSILLALQCIFLLFRMQYFSRVFKSTRFSFLEAIRDVVSEIRHYFLFLIIIMFGFAAAFHILFRRDQAVTHFDTLAHSLIKVYFSQEGLDYKEMLKSRVPVAATVLNTAYSFVMGMVLVNLLIGLMGNALNKASEHEALKLLQHKAHIIDELEVTLPKWIEEKFDDKWYPKYVQVLRIDHDRIDRVDLLKMWKTDEELSDNRVSAATASGGYETLSGKMDDIQNAISALSVQLQAMRSAHQSSEAATSGVLP